MTKPYKSRYITSFSILEKHIREGLHHYWYLYTISSQFIDFQYNIKVLQYIKMFKNQNIVWFVLFFFIPLHPVKRFRIVYLRLF